MLDKLQDAGVNYALHFAGNISPNFHRSSGEHDRKTFDLRIKCEGKKPKRYYRRKQFSNDLDSDKNNPF